jgi:hypothetical protein
MLTPENQPSEAEIRRDAVSVLENVLGWELAPARWDRLAETIDIAGAAEAAGDLNALREATIQLELSGPVWVIRIGSPSTVPPPPPLRERVTDLIHSLRGAGPDGPR